MNHHNTWYDADATPRASSSRALGAGRKLVRSSERVDTPQDVPLWCVGEEADAGV